MSAAAELQAYVWLYLDQAMDLRFGAIGNALYKLLDHEWPTGAPSTDTFKPRDVRAPSNAGGGIDYGFDPLANTLWFRRDWPTPPEPSTVGETPITQKRLRNLFDTDREIYKDLMTYFEDPNGYRAWREERGQPVIRSRTEKLLTKHLGVEPTAVRRCRGAVVLGASDPLIWIGVTHNEALIRERDAGKRAMRIQRRIDRAPQEERPTWAIAAEKRYAVAARVTSQPASFTSMMRELMRDRFATTPVNTDTLPLDRMTARLGTEEGDWLITYLPPKPDYGAWADGVKAAMKTGSPDYLLAVTTDTYEHASSAIHTAMVESALTVLVRILDIDGALAWCGPVPWVWSKHYGMSASAKVIKPGDQEHLRTVLRANGESQSALAWDGATNRRIVGSTRQALANGVAALLQAYPERVVIVLEQGIDRTVLRIAEGFTESLVSRGEKDFVIVLHDPLSSEAAAKAGYLVDLMRWTKDQSAVARVHGLIAHTPAAPFDDVQAWLEEHGFQAPLAI